MKRLMIGLLAALIYSLGGGFGTLVAAQPTKKLTYASFYGTNEFYEISAKYFMDEVTKRTNGRITFETYYGGSLLKPAEISPGLSRGVADVAVGVPAAFNPREFPLTGVVLPFVSENPMAMTRAFDELLAKTQALQDEFRRNNQKVLWALGSGENSLWTNKPIRNLEDLKGARIRSVLGIADALKELGATPVSVPWVEALELMQRGGVEGVSATSFNQAAVAGTLDMATYGSNGGRMGTYTAVLWAINLDTWNGLDEPTKAIFEEVAKSVPDFYFSRYNQEVDRAVALTRASKVQYVHLDDAEVKRWWDRAQPVIHRRWIDSAKGGGTDPAQLLRDFTGLVRKHEAVVPYVTGFDRLRSGNP